MRTLSIISAIFFSFLANATGVQVLPVRGALPSALSSSNIEALVTKNLNVAPYRLVRVQVIMDAMEGHSHLLVHLHSKTRHSVHFAAIFLDSHFNVVRVIDPYALKEQDRAGQPEVASTACPDPTAEFIAFCPNDVALEQQITKDVAQSARAHGLKTAELLIKDATRANYLAYMSCPNVKGNFYDGDSNPSEFVTVDGVITADEMRSVRFNYSVTNIWLACQAFNDPMMSSLINDAQSQKFAAGISDLEVGPSDNTGKCAMIAALDGQPMTQAFHDCYNQYDVTTDQWGFDGKGADLFGKLPGFAW